MNDDDQNGAVDAVPMIEHVIAELKTIRADLKTVARDTTGLMYKHGPDGLRLREFVAEADTDGPPDQCDDRIWAARGRVTALLDLLDPVEPSGQVDVGTSGGIALTDEVVTQIADEAEQGYAPRYYTVQIEASGDGEEWQAVSGPELVCTVSSAERVAEDTAANQNIADGNLWRVRVWEGGDPWEEIDLGADPKTEYYPPTLLLAGTILPVSNPHIR